MFSKNKIIFDECLKIYVNNVAEQKKIEEYKVKLEEFLYRVGYNNVEIKKIEEDFIKNINESKIITYENWKKRSFIKKVIQYFLYIFSSLF